MAGETVTVHVSGLAEAVKALGELEPRVRDRVLRKAVRDACKPFVQAAKGHVPGAGAGYQGKATGLLQRLIGIKMRQKGASGEKMVTAQVGVLGFAASYAHLLELGHRIAPRRKGFWALLGLPGKRDPAAGSVPAHPFLKPAFDAEAEHVVNSLVDTLEAGVAREAAALAT